jgi:hypothetical protein
VILLGLSNWRRSMNNLGLYFMMSLGILLIFGLGYIILTRKNTDVKQGRYVVTFKRTLTYPSRMEIFEGMGNLEISYPNNNLKLTFRKISPLNILGSSFLEVILPPDGGMFSPTLVKEDECEKDYIDSKVLLLKIFNNQQITLESEHEVLDITDIWTFKFL